MFNSTLPFIDDYIEALNDAIKQNNPSRKLSRIQRIWLKFCLMGIILTNTVNWSAFERAGLGGYRFKALSYMFRRTKIVWDYLPQSSVMLILRANGITEGVLVTDDSDHKRAKRTKRMHGAHKVYDKKTGGYFNGQTLIFLVLVTPKITVPVGFRFYSPDPK